MGTLMGTRRRLELRTQRGLGPILACGSRSNRSVPAAASAHVWRADAQFAASQLANDWRTSDGVRFDYADCTGVWSTRKWEYGEYFFHRFNCYATDVLARAWKVHFIVHRTSDSVIQYRCDDSQSAYACP